MTSARQLLVVVCVLGAGVLLVGATGGGAAGAGGVTPTPTPTETPTPGATTGAAVPVNETAVLLYGSFEGTNGSVDVHFQYREQTPGGEWRRTESLEVLGGDRFVRNVTGLQPSTTYEYRAVLSTPNGTWRGAVRTVNTTDGEPTETETPTGTPTEPWNNCTNARGAAMWTCTATPSPTPEEVSVPDLDGGGVASGDGRGWQDNGLLLVGWFLAVVVLAPVVLGGLLGLDSLRGRE